MLTRAEFLTEQPVRVTTARLLDGREVFLRSWTEVDFAEYQGSIWRMSRDGRLEMVPDYLTVQRRKSIELGLSDKDGNRLLQAGDGARLAGLDALLVADLADQCRRHCGLDAAAEDHAKNSDGSTG